jgi:hypothetical protein
MIKDKVKAGILTIVILYLCLRIVAVLYGVVRVVTSPLPNKIDTIYHNYPELDRRNLKSQLKYHENNQIKIDSTR